MREPSPCGGLRAFGTMGGDRRSAMGDRNNHNDAATQRRRKRSEMAMTVETTAATLEEQPIGSEDDVVEGAPEADMAGPAAAKTVGEAANEYFEWCEKRAAQREKRAQRQQEENGRPAPRSRKAAPPFDKTARIAVTQFVSHVTPSLPISELTPHGMAAFQEAIGANAMNVADRLYPVKDFLRFCWKNCGYTEANLGNHLRVKTASAAAEAALEHEEAERFEMTADGLEQLKADLERLREELPAAIQAVAQAREDKDIRENAPLEAARENQERLNSRINELAYQIAHAVISENQATGRAHLGSTVGVRRLDAGNDQVQRYTLVGPTEVNAEERRISVESPVGKGLVDATVGAIVQIEVPRGTMRFEVVSVDG